MFQQYHREYLSEAWTCFNDLLQKVPHHGLDLWLQIQIFYDHIDGTTQRCIDYASGERLRKLSPVEAWATIKRVAQYEDEGWNDALTPEEMSFNYENPDIEQLLGIMEHKVDTLMKDAISLMKESESEMSKRSRSTRGQASSSHNETMEEKNVVDWEILSNKGLTQSFFDSINTDPFSGPQWANLFQINETIFHELTREFFALFGFDATPCRYEPLHKGVTFRLGGVEREMPLLEFVWRPSVGDGMFNVGYTKAQSIRNPRVKLAHRCITMTITGRKETTNRVTDIDLFFLYCFFWEWVVCNIPYWLAKYLKSVRDKSVIFRGVYVTKISRSYGSLTNEMVSVLNREPPLHVYKKTSLVKIGVIMELHEGKCCWPATREVVREGKGDDEGGNGEGGNEGVGGSTDIYRHMSQGYWQVRQARWMDQQDEHWVRIDAWMEQQDERAHWMYDHTVRQFQHLSTRDNLEPYLQIDPFPRFETDYPPYGYQGCMPPGYTYRPYPPQDGFS
ncbi:hypothetical protein Tco_1401074 [Tanacetum coccineum]